MTSEAPAGLAFGIDASGVVTSVLRDGVGLGERLCEGIAFESLLEPASRVKWVNFVRSIGDRKAAFNWQMDLVDCDNTGTLDFAGVESEAGLFVVATPIDDDQSTRMYEQLLAVSNEQSTALRDALKRLSLARRAQPGEIAPAMWIEQTRMNNELVNLQRELSRRNAQLKRSIELRNELLGIAAHDLRNPISSVRLFAEVLLASKLDERQRKSLGRIHDICDFMVRIVDDMLDLSALESGRLDLRLESVDLVALVADTVALNRDLAAVKRVSIELACTAPLPPVSLDRRRFEQVLNNLLTNAVKFSYLGSSVTVDVGQHDGSAVVAVRDRGQGIPEPELEFLFKPFVRGSNRPTGGERSTGLGLAIVDRIVRAHCGSIKVESVVGQGSVFAVLMPLEPAAIRPTG